MYRYLKECPKLPSIRMDLSGESLLEATQVTTKIRHIAQGYFESPLSEGQGFLEDGH